LKRVFNYQGVKQVFELLNILLVAGAVQPSLHDAISGLPVSGRQAIKIFFPLSTKCRPSVKTHR